MPALRLENDTDVLSLDDVLTTGEGWEALAGATGLGLPPVALQYSEGAGNGANFRGRRFLAREMDLPLYADGGDREGLKALMRRMSLMLREGCRLYFVDDRDEQWYLDVERSGGGDYAYGFDTTGERELQTIVTLRAGDPFWKATQTRTHIVRATAGDGLLMHGHSLVDLALSPSQTFGQINLDNPGDEEAPASWTVRGPGSNLVLTSPSGLTLRWDGTLNPGERLIIAGGKVTDGNGVNRYDLLGPVPKFWKVPAGQSVAVASMDGVAAGQTSISVTYQPRRGVMI